MGARSGNNYLSSLRKLKAELWLGEARIEDPSIHPAFVRRARAIASLYDLQIEHPEAMTYRLDDGDRANLSFIRARSAMEVQRRGAMFRRLADSTFGTLLSTPDATNAMIAGLAAASEYFNAADPRFGQRLNNYYVEARRHDWCIARSLASSEERGLDWAGMTATDLTLKLTASNDRGITVSGARRMTELAALAEELIILPAISSTAESPELAFAINSNARGLKLLCNNFEKPFQGSGSDSANHSLEFDCVALFDRVEVPWERVFHCASVPRWRALLAQTGAVIHLLHQEIARIAAKAELFTGAAAALMGMSPADKSSRPADGLAELITIVTAIQSCMRAAESDSRADKFGSFAPARAPLEAARDLFARHLPQMVSSVRRALPSLSRQAEASDRPLLSLADKLVNGAFDEPSSRYEEYLIDDQSLPRDLPVSSGSTEALVKRIQHFATRLS